MALIYEVNSLINAQETIIAHGCNNKGEMGAGVALAIKNRWPKVYSTYQFAHASGALSLGSVAWCERSEGKHVANVITQHTYGKVKGQRYVSYDAVDKGLRTVITDAFERNYLNYMDRNTIAIPAIGSGNGGGRWHILKEIIAQVSHDTKVDFKVYCLSEQELKALTGE